jgi:hypothetical protein
MAAPTQPAPTQTGEYPAPPTRNAGRGFTIAGGVCAVLALVLLPPLFGLLGLALGLVGYKRNDRYGLHVAIASVVCLVAGLVLGAALFHAMRS